MRFGIIGCGTIAQVMHIPYAVELPDVDLYALVDPSADRRRTLGDRYGVAHTFADTEELLDEVGDELDAVVVLTPAHTHADVVEQTLAAGVHTLVEKPLAVSPDAADRAVAAAERSDATAMVAYMKRYDPAYRRAKREIADLDAVDRVTAYDVDPDHGRIIEEVYDLVEGDLPQSLVERSVADRRRASMDAIGCDDEALADDYHWHLEHICHDVNALRGLFGDVERIDHVDLFADGRYATASLVYEGGHRCTLDSGLSERKWFEEYIRVDAPEGAVTVDFSNPFVRNTPTECRVKRGVEELTESVHAPSYAEPFKLELEHFRDCVRGDAEVRTTFAEARDDVALIADLFREYQGIERLGGA